MSLKSKVIWSEGMFLQPHHLQQQDRYWEYLIINHSSYLHEYNWGINELTIDAHLLALGKIAINSCQGILPDGTLINIPAVDDPPLPIDIPEGINPTTLYLALPLPHHGIEETGVETSYNYRYQIKNYNIPDNNEGADNISEIQIGKLHFRLLLDNQERSAYSCLAIAKIREKQPDHKIILDSEFIPPCLNIHALPLLSNFIHELAGLLHQRAEALASRITETGQEHNITEIADFMLLQVLNRAEPLITHFAYCKNLHPQLLFIILLQLSGELATFTANSRRPILNVTYSHHDLHQTFKPLINEIRRSLSTVLEQNAIALPMEKREHGMWVSPLLDHSVLTKFQLVIAITADLPLEILRTQIPLCFKVAPIEHIYSLITQAISGIELHALAVAPRQIPFHANFLYFTFNQHHRYWKELEKSGGIAFHVSGNFPGLIINLWAIRG